MSSKLYCSELNESRAAGCPTASSAVYPISDVSAALIERTIPRTSVVTFAIGSVCRAAKSRSVSDERSDIISGGFVRGREWRGGRGIGPPSGENWLHYPTSRENG